MKKKMGVDSAIFKNVKKTETEEKEDFKINLS